MTVSKLQGNSLEMTSSDRQTNSTHNPSTASRFVLNILTNEVVFDRLCACIPGFAATSFLISREFTCTGAVRSQQIYHLTTIFDRCVGRSLLFDFIHVTFAPWKDPECTRNPKEAWLALKDELTGIPCSIFPTPEVVIGCNRRFQKMQEESLRLVWGPLCESFPPPHFDVYAEAQMIGGWMHLNPGTLGEITFLDLGNLRDRTLVSVWTDAYEEVSTLLQIPEQNTPVQTIREWMDLHPGELQRLCELNEENEILTDEEFEILNTPHSALRDSQVRLKLEIIRDLHPQQVLEPPLLLPDANADAQTIDNWSKAHPAVLERIPRLKLGQSCLTCVPHKMALLPNLQKLYLSGNALSTLCPPSVLRQLTRFEVLNLSWNRFGPEVFSCLNALSPSLKSLYLEGNALGALSPSDVACGQLNRLEELDLSSTGLERLDPGTFRILHALTTLKLARNHLQTLLPETFEGLNALTSLDVSFNALHTLSPEVFRGLPLRTLNLSHNALRTLSPEAFRGLNALGSLDLAYNELLTLPPRVFQDLNALYTLFLHDNHQDTIHQDVFSGLRALLHLNLGRNQIHRVHPAAFAELTALQNLQLDGNQIQTLHPPVFQNLSALRRLVLSNNRLHTLSPVIFQNLNVLRHLYLEFNSFETIDPDALNPMRQLIELTLDGGLVLNRENLPTPFVYTALRRLPRLHHFHLNLPLRDLTIFCEGTSLSLINRSTGAVSALPPLSDLSFVIRWAQTQDAREFLRSFHF